MRRLPTIILALAAVAACDRSKPTTDASATLPVAPPADTPAAAPMETVFVAQVPPPAPRRQPRPEPPPPPRPQPNRTGPDQAPPRGGGSLEAGTEIRTTLTEGIDSRLNGPGEPIRATVTNDVLDGDRVVIPAGSTVTFRINAIGPATGAGERATLDLTGESVDIHGRSYRIRGAAADYDFELRGRSVNGGDVATAAGGAAIGALIGHVLGGKTGTIIGAVGGGAVGTAQAAKHVDRDIVVHPGTAVTLTLLEPFDR